MQQHSATMELRCEVSSKPKPNNLLQETEHTLDEENDLWKFPETTNSVPANSKSDEITQSATVKDIKSKDFKVKNIADQIQIKRFAVPKEKHPLGHD